jgi:hypothetical protein
MRLGSCKLGLDVVDDGLLTPSFFPDFSLSELVRAKAEGQEYQSYRKVLVASWADYDSNEGRGA